MSVFTRLGRAAAVTAFSGIALLGTALPASAEPINVLPGCWGVGFIVCDLTIDIEGPYSPEPSTIYVPVCTGECEYVPVPIYTVVSQNDHYCYSYATEPGGTAVRRCQKVVISPGLPVVG